jgi:hypothetical protein
VPQSVQARAAAEHRTGQICSLQCSCVNQTGAGTSRSHWGRPAAHTTDLQPVPRAMPRLATAGVVVAALIQAASGFTVAGYLPLRTAGGVRGRCANAAGVQWTCSSADDYKIVPSQLEGTGGGWTIQGVKPVSRAPSAPSRTALRLPTRAARRGPVPRLAGSSAAQG